MLLFFADFIHLQGLWLQKRQVACMYDVLHVTSRWCCMIVATNVLELPKRRPLMMSKVTINVSLGLSLGLCDMHYVFCRLLSKTYFRKLVY